MKAKCN